MDLVFSSSCTVYGSAVEMPLKETAPTNKQQSPYGVTKAVGETLISHAVANKKFRATSLRFFNPVGAHESGLIGEVQTSKTETLLPIIVDVALGNRTSLEVFGANYPTSDGSCIRDFIHVCDVAEAHVAALGYMKSQENTFYEVFNIGVGKGTSVFEMVSRFESINKVKVKKLISDRRIGDIVVSWADVQKSKDVLDWQATRSLDDIVKTAWNFANKMEQQEDR